MQKKARDGHDEAPKQFLLFFSSHGGNCISAWRNSVD